MFFDDLIFIGKGLLYTMKLTFLSLFFGIILGISISVCRYLNKGKFFFDQLISVIRGTPVLLQLSFFYFAIPSFIGLKLSIFQAGVVTFSLNSSAYLAEVFRAGIESLPKGQFEAAKTLQIPSSYAWKDIILPQVFRSIFPALINETIALLKETAVISMLGGMDLMRRATILGAQRFTYFEPLLITAIYYYLTVNLIAFLGNMIEKKYFQQK